MKIEPPAGREQYQEYDMVPGLLLCAAWTLGQAEFQSVAVPSLPRSWVLMAGGEPLLVGQAEKVMLYPPTLSPPTEEGSTAPPSLGRETAAPLAPLTSPQRGLLMAWLQGTWIGSALDDHRTSVSGWAAMAYVASTTQDSNSPVAWNDRADEFLLEQFWLRLDHPVVARETTEPTFGYRFDIFAGTDYRHTLARELFNSQLLNSQGKENFYGVDPIQFYVNGYVPSFIRGTEFRVGRFFNPWGFEAIEAINTPLVSRSYTYHNTPFTFTGLGAYPTFNGQWSGAIILADGNDTFLGPAGEPRFVGALFWISPNKRNSLALGTSLGRGKFNVHEPFNPPTRGLAYEPAGHNNYNAFDLVFTHTFNPVFSYSLETLFAYQTAVPANVPGGIISPGAAAGSAHWASAVNYFQYTFSSRLSGIVRLEFFDDSDGQRTGFRGLYTAFTGDLVYRPHRAIMVRPEIRFDHNGQSRPFEGRHSILTATGEIIFRW